MHLVTPPKFKATVTSVTITSTPIFEHDKLQSKILENAEAFTNRCLDMVEIDGVSKTRMGVYSE